MKDFQLRNDTKLLFREDPVSDLTAFIKGKKVLFISGGGSVRKNGCYDDVKVAIDNSGGILFELSGASRELEMVEKGIGLAKENGIDLVIGAGGASIMDCAKLIAFGAFHREDLWDYIKGKKNPYGLAKLPLILIPTYPSSGSEYGLGAVCTDERTGDFGTAYGIAADTAILVPKYSLSLGSEMTTYSGLVTLVQLFASTMGDTNPVSYDIGTSVIRNVLKATKRLKENPDDMDARGVILYSASISTSSRLGLGKTQNYPYDIYELEFIPEVLFGATYRKSLTTVFPRFLKIMGRHFETDVTKFIKDAFGYEGSVEKSADKLTALFSELGVDMYFDGEVAEDKIGKIDIETIFSIDEVIEMMNDCMR